MTSIRAVLRTWCASLATAALIQVAVSTPAAAQTPKPPSPTGWVFEVHFGSMPTELPTSSLASGSSPLPAAEGNFTTTDGSVSRQVPSWYFGDGTVLANQVANQIGQSAALLVPLDPVLTSASLGRNSGGNVGVRIGHTITRYVLFTFCYDRASGHLALSPAASAAIAATTASFQTYWTASLTRANTTNVLVGSTDTISDGVGSAQLFSFATEIRPVTIYGFRPYFAFGSGLAFPSTDTPTVLLTGHYQVTLVSPLPNNGAQVAQTDSVQISYRTKASVMKVFGGGVEKDLMPHLGFRVDLRTFPGALDIQTRLDSQNGTTNPTPTKGVVFRRGLSPELQISTAAQSSLSGPGVNHLFSFEGIGKATSFTGGFYVRF